MRRRAQSLEPRRIRRTFALRDSSPYLVVMTREEYLGIIALFQQLIGEDWAAHRAQVMSLPSAFVEVIEFNNSPTTQLDAYRIQVFLDSHQKILHISYG